MSFINRVPFPAGVEKLRRYDRRSINGNISKLSLFTPSPQPNDPDNNYVQNPLSGPKNHVVYGISVNCLSQFIESTENIDPVKVANLLKDAVLKIEVNGGREERILHPLKDYMNFSQSNIVTTAAAANTADAPVEKTTVVTLQATGPRLVDNLFYIAPGETFTVEVLFKNGDFPAEAEWVKGRFGLEVELYLAQMDQQQLREYEARMLGA